ncbi:MAG: hypothetical protein ABSG03_13695 [Bryobacteraceae bacterium]|jgi:hypothetical protein
MSATGENLLAEEKREALNLVCQSQTFARSDTLKNLLRFVCEAEIEGHQEDLKEYVIGIEALGRPKGYSPSEDSSVRSRAYELRRKLEKFYATEATGASLRIEIPKGSYIPRFVQTPVFEQPAPPLHPVAVLPLALATLPAAVRRLPSRLIIAFLAGVVLTAGAMTAWNAVSKGQPTRYGAWTPDLEAIWRPLIDSKAPILVSFQTRLFLRIGPVNVRDWHVDTLGAVESSEGLMRIKQLFNAPQLYENRDYVDFGSANAVFQLSKLLATRKQNIFAKRSTDVTWDDMNANNVIIMGKPEADPTVSRWLAKGKFLEVGGHIRNLHPASGEQSEWVDHADPPGSSTGWAQKYALITMFAGPGQGNWVMCMAGSGAEHPWAMADYLTMPEHATELVRHLRLPSGRLPTSYQVVIRVDFKSQIPVKVSYVAHRSLDTP